jgi:hypothetical protein
LGVARLVFVFTTLLSAAAEATPVTWVNETDLPAEADFAILQFPASIFVSAGMPTGLIFGQIFENGMTPGAGANASITADVGFGPGGTDPRTNASWTWVAAAFSAQVGNNDEYQQQLIAPLVNGTYSYTYRFSLDGINYTAADLDGAGSNAGLTFDVNKLGTMTVTGGVVATPEPTARAFVALGVVLLAMIWVLRG